MEWEDAKILQIITPPPYLAAIYETKGVLESAAHVICLALVEHENGERSVMPMTADGPYIMPEDASNFSRLEIVQDLEALQDSI